MKELFGQRLREQRIKHGLTLEQLAEKSELSSNYIGMVERGLKEPGLATIVKLLNALNISADTLLCDLVPSASHVTDDEIRKRLEGLTPIQKKAALDLLDTYISNLPTSQTKNKSQTLQAHRLKFSRCAFLCIPFGYNHSYRMYYFLKN
ncbi:helix-turn-helix transcriptional regulator [Faecalibacterium taiwanense]